VPRCARLCHMHRATYAHRFNARAIKRPEPPALTPAQMSDAQFAEYLATLTTELARAGATFARAMSLAFPNRKA